MYFEVNKMMNGNSSFKINCECGSSNGTVFHKMQIVITNESINEKFAFVSVLSFRQIVSHTHTLSVQVHVNGFSY